MSKGKPISNEHTVIDTLCVSIVSLLFKEGKVVIPELGYLELKVFPDKRTVLFKATESLPLFLSSEGSIQSHIYNSISVPLKEGKVVTLPEVGIFRPMKNANGSSRISYTISSSLRKLLNDEIKESETEKPEISGAPVTVADEIMLAPVVDGQDVLDKSAGEEEKKETAVSKAAETNEEIKEKVIVSTPDRVKGERKIPSYVRNSSKVGDLVVSQEKTESNATKMRGIIAVVAALIALILLVWYFLPQGKNKYRDESAFVSNDNKTESTQEINESIKPYKSIDLPSLAEQKYGNRIFWVYIYEANRDKISSPVNIPAGTDLRIPNLWEDYKVDVMDSMEIKRAGILSDIMLKQKIQL
jgi:hypothetical protein